MEYKFPFDELISQNFTRVYIFGAGSVGNSFQSEICERGGVLNLGFIDNFVTTDTAKSDVIKRAGVYKPEILRTAEYDCVVLACDYAFIPGICESLFKAGVDSKKLYCLK